MLAAPHQPPRVSDEALAERAARGDLNAMDALVRRWQSPLLAFLQRRVASRADAEDLFQETFLRVHQALPSYDPARSFKTWLFTIAWRLAANHLRGRRLRIAQTEPPDTAAHIASPPQALASREACENLWHLAHRLLGQETATLLWLVYAEDLTLREVAQVTGRSWVGVKVSLHRARKRLAAALPPEERTV